MSVHFIEPGTSDRSTPFLDMAARIDHAKNEEFGGALVLVAPDGKKLSFLLTDPEANLVAFWGFVKSRIEDAFNEYQSQNATAGWITQRR